jgi:cytochrome c biogenesis factor
MRDAPHPLTMWGLTMWLALIATGWLMLKPRLHEEQPALSTVLHLALVLPFVALARLFLVNDTSVLHVAAFGGEDLPLKYRFAATWAAREGPLLMWLGWMSLVAWLWRRPLPGEAEAAMDAQGMRLRLMHLMSLTLLLIAFSLDPFKETPPFFIGAGLNPLLQTDLMVIHPPLIFLTYALCLHLTAIAMAAAFTNETEKLGPRMLHLARPGLLMATLGIGLGGLWAYLILDWGGYWAWDPVETGSFLPWLALVMLVHLRTRPGKVRPEVWIGGGLVTGMLALFATTVTRAGGVWASSVHTFVTSDTSTPPSDVFGRLMVLRDDPAGTEVMAYVVWMFMLIGCWLAVQRSVASNRPLRLSDAWVVACPAAIALLGCLLFTGSNGEGLSWASVPHVFFIVPLFLPMLLVRRSGQPPASDDAKPWAYHRLVPVPLDLVFALAIYALSSDAWIATAATVLFVPMYRAEDALKAWPWAAGGVMLGLSLAWSQALSLGVAGFILVAFVLPWLLAPQEEEAASLSPWESKGQLRMALWGSVIIVSLYLVLTWVLLLTSIDAVNFEAHELYGAPFLAAVGAGLFVYTRRKDNAMATFRFLCGALALSVLGFLLAPDAFGRDAPSSVSEHLTRGHIVWMSLPMLLLAVAPVGREVVNHLRVAKAKGAWKRLPLGAHVVHFGLLLLLLGHLSTTVLVDRGDASHRISLVKDEIIVHEGLGLEFTGLELNDQNLEVGDGFIGVRIAVYEMDGNDVGALIGEVIPGTLRFDDQGVPRSEVATLTRLTGDVVFIFDGSQAGALMSSAGANGLDGIELVRVTVYNLPHSHLVWVGWCAMMAGMAYVALAGAGSSIKSSKEAPIRALEEE